MRRRLFPLFAGLLATSLTAAAHASSITCDLTLTQQTGNITPIAPGNVVGTGSFAIVSPTSTPGSLSYFALNINIPNPANPISALTFTLSGDTFNLANAGINTVQISFSNDILTQIIYTGIQQFGKVSTFFNANGALTYTFSDGGNYSNGIISGVISEAPTAAAPEPSSFALFGTAALGLLGLTRRNPLS